MSSRHTSGRLLNVHMKDDYELFLQSQELFENASKARERGNWKLAYKLETEFERLTGHDVNNQPID